MLTILIRILDQDSQFLDAQLDGGTVVGHATADADQHGDHRVDALVEQAHCGGAAHIKNSHKFGNVVKKLSNASYEVNPHDLPLDEICERFYQFLAQARF